MRMLMATSGFFRRLPPFPRTTSLLPQRAVVVDRAVVVAAVDVAAQVVAAAQVVVIAARPVLVPQALELLVQEPLVRVRPVLVPPVQELLVVIAADAVATVAAKAVVAADWNLCSFRSSPWFRSITTL